MLSFIPSKRNKNKNLIMERKELKIIVRMPNWLGDFVMALPVLKILRKSRPEAKIYAMCKYPLGDLIESAPYIDGLVPFKKPKHFLSKETLNISKEIKKYGFDVGILLTNSFSSAFYFFMAKIPFLLGYSSFFRNLLFLNKKVKKEGKKIHQVESYQNLLNNFLGEKNSYIYPCIEVDKKQKEKYLNKLLDQGLDLSKKNIICLNPHAAYGLAKCWPIERYKKLAVRLIKDGFFIVIIGDKKAAKYTKDLFKDSENILNLSGKTTLKELLIVLDISSFVITNDSGPMHLAAALNKPLLAIFGSTSPRYTSPYKMEDSIVYKKEPCSPCFKRSCPKEFKCMKDISVSEIYEKVKSKIKKSNK